MNLVLKKIKYLFYLLKYDYIVKVLTTLISLYDFSKGLYNFSKEKKSKILKI